MALGNNRRHWRIEALTTAAALMESHAGTEAMLHLSEDNREIFTQECERLANQLMNKAKKLGFETHDSDPDLGHVFESHRIKQ